MSKMVHINLNNKEYLFSCSSRNTRSGFAHDCTMYCDYNEINSASCYYLNRTWEYWTYQSACIAAVENEISWKMGRIREEYKHKNSLQRIAGKRKEELQALIDSNDYIKELRQVKEELRKKVY